MDQSRQTKISDIKKLAAMKANVAETLFEIHGEQERVHHDYNHQKRLLDEIRQGNTGGYGPLLQRYGMNPTVYWPRMSCAPARILASFG